MCGYKCVLKWEVAISRSLQGPNLVVSSSEYANVKFSWRVLDWTGTLDLRFDRSLDSIESLHSVVIDSRGEALRDGFLNTYSTLGAVVEQGEVEVFSLSEDLHAVVRSSLWSDDAWSSLLWLFIDIHFVVNRRSRWKKNGLLGLSTLDLDVWLRDVFLNIVTHITFLATIDARAQAKLLLFNSITWRNLTASGLGWGVELGFDTHSHWLVDWKLDRDVI